MILKSKLVPITPNLTPPPSSRMANPKVIFVLGAPGAGKGTQCTKLSEKYGYQHISAGDLLRKEVRENGPDGELISVSFWFSGIFVISTFQLIHTVF